MSDKSFLDPYIDKFINGSVEERNRAVESLMRFYQSVVVEYVEENHGRDVAYSLAKAIWFEYQLRTEGCDCTSDSRW